MRATRIIIGLLLAILVVLPLATTTLTLMAVNGWLLDRNFYRSLANDTRVYEVWLAESRPDYGNAQATTNVDDLPVGALDGALRKVVTPQYLRDQAVSVLDQSFNVLEGSAGSPAVFLDVAPIKATLGGPAAATFAASLAAGLPVCPAGTDALAPGASIVRCRIPGDSTEQTAALIATGLSGYLNRLPDQINIARDDSGFPYRLFGFSWLGAGRLGLVLAILVAMAITGAFWVLAAFIGAESMGGRLQ